MSSSSRKKCLRSQTRETIAKVYEFLKIDARDILELVSDPVCSASPILISKLSEHLNSVRKRTAMAVGVSERTVTNILAEGKESDSKFKSPHKDRKKRLKKLELDNFNVNVIRSTIQNYHLEHRELPTLLKLKGIFQDKLNYDGSISTLRTALLKLGYKWRKTVDNRRVIIERHDIQKLRFSYLKNLLRYRQENRCIVYTDESYILTNHVQNKGWGNKDGPPLKRNLSKGQRIIIVHAGSEQGFVPNALLTYKANSVSGDYHSNMNAENYEKWLKERLVPNLPPNSVVVLDNASYHNVQNDRAPNSNSKKIEMQRWLTEKNIAFNQDMKKIELYDLIKKNKENYICYKIDDILQRYGIKVLRLPPYHPELNPIENVWGILKNYIASRNVDQNVTEIMKLINECLSQIDEGMWGNTCRHVQKKEEEYYRHFDMESEFIINLDESSESENSSFDFSSSDSE
ncbi:uncharacterized protein LOC120623223 [Pararge aegeria]|uniref:uncharacterized protein LOC120623223 n=1 Tax=Pararge aegeria TaxID=116150 RepID=UPI0019D14D18|nr:uncharacterized protein LOC120623223 [Pararge aegeria]